MYPLAFLLPSPNLPHYIQLYQPCPFILLTLPNSLRNPSLNIALHRLLLNSFFACPLLTCVRCRMLSFFKLFAAHRISRILNADCRSRLPLPGSTPIVRPSIGVSRRWIAAKLSCVFLASMILRPSRTRCIMSIDEPLWRGWTRSSTSTFASSCCCSAARSREGGVGGVPCGRWAWNRFVHWLGRGSVLGLGDCVCDCEGGDDGVSSCSCEGEVLSSRVDVDAPNVFRLPCGCLRALEGVRWE